MDIRYLAVIPAVLALAACVPEGANPIAQANPPPAVEPVACDAPMGSLVVREPASRGIIDRLAQLGIDSPVNALRVIAQRSNCFEVMDLTVVEQRLEAARRSTRATPALGTTVYVLQPSLSVISPNFAPDQSQREPARVNTGDQGTQRVLGNIGATLRNIAADTSLMMVELESGRQIAVAQGNQAGGEFDPAGALFGPQARGLGSGFAQTPEGRTMVVALNKAFNALVADFRAQGKSAQLLSAVPAAPPPAAVPERVAPAFRANADFVVAAGVNFRAAPITGAVKRALPPGARVKTTDQPPQRGWWEIVVDGDTGWVSSQFLRAP